MSSSRHRSRPPALAGSSASHAASLLPRRSATQPRTPISTTTCCTATARAGHGVSPSLRGRYLDADVRQLALWDGDPPLGAASTAIDVTTWQRRGRPTSIVTPLGERLVAAPTFPTRPPDSATTFAPGRAGNTLRPTPRHFSKLTDEELPRFADRVLGAFAAVLERHGEHILHRNTWGDALYVVLRDGSGAAACALELQEAMSAIDLAEGGLPGHLALPARGSCGSGVPDRRPSPAECGRTWGLARQPDRAHRAGHAAVAVYVTESFAAALALSWR